MNTSIKSEVFTSFLVWASFLSTHWEHFCINVPENTHQGQFSDWHTSFLYRSNVGFQMLKFMIITYTTRKRENTYGLFSFLGKRVLFLRTTQTSHTRTSRRINSELQPHYSLMKIWAQSSQPVFFLSHSLLQVPTCLLKSISLKVRL